MPLSYLERRLRLEAAFVHGRVGYALCLRLGFPASLFRFRNVLGLTLFRALKELRSTSIFLSDIRDTSTRGCVAQGVNIRIAKATAGETFLSQHPGDLAGAKSAAAKAWQAFPVSTNCP